jgi:hypothetical protein
MGAACVRGVLIVAASARSNRLDRFGLRQDGVQALARLSGLLAIALLVGGLAVLVLDSAGRIA